VKEEVSARVGGATVSATFEGDVRATPEAAVAAFILPAMQRGEALEIEQPVSARLLEALPTLQDVFSTWWPKYRPVPVLAEPVSDSSAEATNGVGCFFSGGVDSFYTVLRSQEEITHLVFVQGFDIPLANPSLLERATAAAREAAAALGKPLIIVRTDLKEAAAASLVPPLTPNAFWPHYHGAALATVGHLLAHVVDTIIVPATHTYRDLFPWGSHPMLDHMWSSDGVAFVHYGAETTRFEKVQAIAHAPAVLDHLRVCWRNPDGAYNCGRCEKCVRTMIALHVAGALEECATLPRRLDYSAVRRMWLQNENDVAFADENLAGADAAGYSALSRAIRYAKVRSAFGRALPSGIKPIARRFARRSSTPATHGGGPET
jgi:hypothetical protein